MYKRVAPRRYRKRAVPARRRVAIYRPGRRLGMRTANPQPTFVETFRLQDVINVTAAPYLDAWKVRISDIPQIADYTALYNQYRINWVQHMLIPAYNSEEANQAGANQGSGVLGYIGQPRIAYAIQDSPNVQPPATEQEVLEDNGCKIKTIHNVFKVSHKPVPDVAVFSNAAGQTVYTKQKYKQFFNFTAVPANNPLHGAVQVAITSPGFNSSHPMAHYVKVSFTLRDPK